MLRWAVEFPEGEVGKEREGERVDVWAAGVAAASVGREVLCGWWVGGWLAEAGWQVVLVWRGRGAWLAWRGGWRREAQLADSLPQALDWREGATLALVASPACHAARFILMP